MWTVTLRGVRGLRPAEQQTPWVAWACLLHPPPSFYGQGLRGLETRARPSPKLLPALAFPASSGSSLTECFHFPISIPAPSREPRPSGGEPVVWTSQKGSREFAISWMGPRARHGCYPMSPVDIRGQGHASGKCAAMPVSGTGSLLHSLLGNWVSVFLPKLE